MQKSPFDFKPPIPMRTVKWRGKSKRTGEWLYGSLVQQPSGECRIYEYAKSKSGKLVNRGGSIDYRTVGMCVSMTGKVDVYEGDILQGGDDIYTVVWDEDSAAFKLLLDDNILLEAEGLSDLDVMGNIHDQH